MEDHQHHQKGYKKSAKAKCHMWTNPVLVKGELASYNGRFDADTLHSALKGWGTSDEKLIDVLGGKNRHERNAIAYQFAYEYGDLEKKIKHDTSGNYERLLIGLATPFPIYMAQLFNKAVKGIGTKESLLMDLLGTQSNWDILEATRIYGILYGKKEKKKDKKKDKKNQSSIPEHDNKSPFDEYDKFSGNPNPTLLHDHIKGDTSFNFRQLLLSLLTAKREESQTIRQDLVDQDARDLKKGGVGRLGTDDNLFIRVLTQRSNAHIVAVDSAYAKLTGHTLEEAIKKETSGNYEQALVSLSKDRSVYWAERIRSAVKGLGTADGRLRRAFILNTKEQLKEIAKTYQKIYGRDLEKDVKTDTSGNYEKLLIRRLK